MKLFNEINEGSSVFHRDFESSSLPLKVVLLDGELLLTLLHVLKDGAHILGHFLCISHSKHIVVGDFIPLLLSSQNHFFLDCLAELFTSKLLEILPRETGRRCFQCELLELGDDGGSLR